MTLRIQRPFIAAIAAIAMAITGISAAPARADDKDVAKALAIVLGLAAVGVVINDRNNDKKSRREVHKPEPRVRTDKPLVSRPRAQVETRRLPRRVSRKLLPQQCLSNLRTHRGARIQGFGQNCLRRHYQFSDSLPQHCGAQVRTRSGRGFAYDAQCLSRQGYQLSRR